MRVWKCHLSLCPEISKILGTTKNIIAKDSKVFAQEISKYVDSKDQKRGKKDKKEKKDKDKSKPKETSSAEKSSKEKQTIAQQKDKEQKDDGPAPALWPLIRQVNVRCLSTALSTGAILVDLPGVADANAARNSIAKDYMKKCDCIWILAAIGRAVDDSEVFLFILSKFKLIVMFFFRNG